MNSATVTPLAHHDGAVTFGELSVVGGVPDDGAAIFRQATEEPVEIGLGAEIDPSGRVIEQHHVGIGGERPGNDHLLLVAAAERGDRRRSIRCPDLEALEPSRCHLAHTLKRDEAPAANPAQARYGNVVVDRPKGKYAIGGAVTGHECRFAKNLNLTRDRAAASENGSQHLTLTASLKPGQADDFASADLQGNTPEARIVNSVEPDQDFLNSVPSVNHIPGSIPRRTAKQAKQFGLANAIRRPAHGTDPFRITTMRSARSRVSWRRCDMKMKEMPLAHRRFM